MLWPPEVERAVKEAISSLTITIRRLTSADIISTRRKWHLSKLDDSVMSYRTWTLSSADRPGRSWNLNQYDDFVRNFRAFNNQQLVSQKVVPANGVVFETIVNADIITACFAKARRQTYTSMSIDHYVRVYPNAPWTKLGNTSDYKDIVVTIEHKVYEYKAVNASTTSLIITAGVRRMM